MKSELHKAALAYAARGYPVFPCRPDAKEPATAHGFHDASTDPAQIDAWWSENPDYNIAWQPQRLGLAVLDIDGDEGQAALERLEIEHGLLPETYTVRSARGGSHLYFRGDLPPSQSILGPHVDTRGGGSYALLPPSRFAGGTYTVERDVEPAELPAWPGELIEAARRAKAKAIVKDLDLPHNVAAARNALAEMVKRGQHAVEGQGGDKQTYVAAATAINFGLSVDVALDLMMEPGGYNEHCVPPWDEEGLRTKIENAWAYAQNEPGAWGASGDMQTRLGDALAKALAESAAEPRTKHLFDFEELADLPPPDWLVPDLIQEGGSVLLYGPPKTFKSTITLDVAMHIASGLAGWGREAGPPQPVLYVAGEAHAALARSARQWRVDRGLAAGTVPLQIYDHMPPIVADLRKRDAMLQEWADAKVRPALVILDTAAKALRGLNENDSRDVGMFADFVDELRRTLGCAVLAIHHSPKDGGGPRGSVVFTADFDTVHAIERSGTPRDPLITIRNEAQRLAPEREEPWRFEIVNGRLNALSPGDFATRRRMTDPYGAKAVHDALLILDGGPVTTEVLASQMVGHFEDYRDQEKAIADCARKLRSRPDLIAYRSGIGKDMAWQLPVVANRLDQP